MPTSLHEVFVEMVREHPAFVADLLTGPLGVTLPEYDTTTLDTIDFTDVTPTEYRADAVVTFSAGKRPIFAVVVEAQLDISPRKRLTWPVYVTTLRARLDCTVALVVLCADRTVARWCSQPIPVAYPDCRLRPLVLGPDAALMVTDRAVATHQPELTLFGVLVNARELGRSGQLKDVVASLLSALRQFDRDHRRLYHDLAFERLPVQAYHDVEEILMTISAEPEFRSDFMRYFSRNRYNQGQAEGMAQAVVTVLEVRGVDLTDQDRERIFACTDLDVLETWLRRAPFVSTVDELPAD